MNLTEISFPRVKEQIESYLKQEYSKSGVLFSEASPYGQILFVIENLFQLSILYLKNALKQFDLSEAAALNSRNIRNAAIFAGHIPGRNISATGTLKFNIKTSSDLQRDLPGGRITITNRQAIKNKTNSLEYAFNLGSETKTYKIDTSSQFFVSIIQGKWERQYFTGTGEPNQTYQVGIRGSQKDVENFNYEILVNGEYWALKKHIYDLLPDEKACVVRTGFGGGIDIIFGNSGFGAIPTIGATIEVSYLISDGSSGSIFRRTSNDWTFIDQAIDGNGNTVDMGKIFDISIYTDINFGADRESLQFTKNVLPIVSNNFVLGLPQQYAYQLKRLGVFSHVNAYEKYGSIYIVATPNIKLFKNTNSNYFNIDIRAFELDNYEKSKIDKYLRTGGNIQLTRRYTINSPVLSYYVMNIFIITYSDAQDDNVNSSIYDVVSEYFLNLNKFDRIPKSDIISQISTSIKDVHSVDVSFMCKKNEDYHKKAIQDDENRRNQYATKAALKLERPNPTYDPNSKIGIDPLLGDILFDPQEIPIIRGGWYDRNNVYYSDDINDKGLKSINIIKKGSVDPRNRQNI